MDKACIGGWNGLTLACYPPGRSCRLMERLYELGLDYVCNVLGKGHAGLVLLGWWRGRLAAVKVRRLDSRRHGMEREARLMVEASRAGAAPRVFHYGREFIVMEFINGPTLEKALSSGVLNGSMLEEALHAARALDSAHIIHGELHRPWKNVIFTERKAVIVDFDSASVGCGNPVRLISGLARRLPVLKELVISSRFRALARRYYESGCRYEVYEDILDLYLKSLGLG